MSGHQLFRLFLILNGLVSYKPARAAEDLLPKCQSALSACDILVQRQSDQIVVLKQSVKDLKARLDGPRPEVPTLVWTTLAGGLGGALGGETMSPQRNGLAIGGIIGAAVGLGIGLLVR